MQQGVLFQRGNAPGWPPSQQGSSRNTDSQASSAAWAARRAAWSEGTSEGSDASPPASWGSRRVSARCDAAQTRLRAHLSELVVHSGSERARQCQRVTRELFAGRRSCARCHGLSAAPGRAAAPSPSPGGVLRTGGECLATLAPHHAPQPCAACAPLHACPGVAYCARCCVAAPRPLGRGCHGGRRCCLAVAGRSPLPRRPPCLGGPSSCCTTSSSAGTL